VWRQELTHTRLKIEYSASEAEKLVAQQSRRQRSQRIQQQQRMLLSLSLLLHSSPHHVILGWELMLSYSFG